MSFYAIHNELAIRELNVHLYQIAQYVPSAADEVNALKIKPTVRLERKNVQDIMDKLNAIELKTDEAEWGERTGNIQQGLLYLMQSGISRTEVKNEWLRREVAKVTQQFLDIRERSIDLSEWAANEYGWYKKGADIPLRFGSRHAANMVMDRPRRAEVVAELIDLARKKHFYIPYGVYIAAGVGEADLPDDSAIEYMIDENNGFFGIYWS